MELSLIFQLISTTAVILGILFGLLNLRNFQLMRKREAAILMLNSFQTTDFVRGLMLMFDLPGEIDMKTIKSLPKEDYLAFYILLGTWERLGILVHRREIQIDLVDDAFGGTILVSWQRLEGFVAQFRKASKRDTAFEWFQWLAERIQEREHTDAAIPAYKRFKNWKV